MQPKPITENTLFYGDNLDILREYIPSESIDLVYLDPPFNSNRNYNVLFRDESGLESEAQITAFEDTWHWDQSAQDTYRDLVNDAPDEVGQMIGALRSFIGANEMMAYLVMMTARLVELHRVLKPTGSLYLHCDPTASHYLKIIMDVIFGIKHFQNEVIWSYSQGGKSTKHWGRKHDVILFYSKSSEFNFDTSSVREPFTPHKRSTTGSFGGRMGIDENGRQYVEKWGTGKKKLYRYYIDEGKVPEDVWEIQSIQAGAKERLGYPTQKPEELLERIIKASSKEGSWVLDPFCGCGTAIVVAQKLGRKWIGIDITHLAIALMKYRLEAMFPGIKFKVRGEPEDLGAAKQLAHDDRYQFQWWALSLIRAKPLKGQEGSKEGKKGSDKGIDGVITFIDDNTDKPKRVLVQVKSGHVKSGDIRDLVGTVQTEHAAIGVFITLEPPSKDMNTAAVSAGYYHSPGWNQDYPRIQILTIADLLRNRAQVKMPPPHGTFKQAQKVVKESGAEQIEHGLMG